MSVNSPGAPETGYGNPPKRTQFRKGVSGNPKGRPKGKLNFATVLEQSLREKVVIEENGIRKTVTKFGAAIKKLISKAVGGDIVAFRQLMALTASIGLKMEEAKPEGQLSDIDRKLMNDVLARFQESGRGPNDEKPK